MTALVEIAGQQFVVRPELKLNVPHLVGNPGDVLTFDKVLLTMSDDDAVQVGTPLATGSVTATILEHGKGRKILVFHKKRRKGYQKLNGHRAMHTRIQINSVV